MNKHFRIIVVIGILSATCYGIGRLYYHFTAGFLESNIASEFPYQPQWEVRSLNTEEEKEFQESVKQSYYYLGKGCQSYVFLSQDGKYVIKFFKYQRYRLQNWLKILPSLPALCKYREQKIEKKWHKLDGFVRSWKVAFEELKDETGLVFVHLNKTSNLHKTLVLYDKLGLEHRVSLDDMEFCIQKRADMLCHVLLDKKNNGDLEGAKKIIDRLLQTILSEYSRGLADNDHALMQNTGVASEIPVHIDVGQFVHNDAMKDPKVYQIELFTKMYKFRIWLGENYPELKDYVDSRLEEIIGPSFKTMQPRWRERH